MSHPTPAPIAIIGGGPCGLTFARLLEIAGIDYVVFERDASSEPTGPFQGGTLDLHPHTGQAALKAAGLKDEFEKLARREAAIITLQDAHGNHRTRFGQGKKGNDGPMFDRPEIDRIQLRKLLLDSLPAHRVRWGKGLRSVERDGTSKSAGAGGWVLRFTDGSSERGFRLIVGADGAWSKVRPLITPAKPIYSGKTYIEGRISLNNPQYAAALEMAGAGNSAAMGAGRMIAVQQMSDRTYRMYAGIEEPESLTRPGGPLDFADLDKAKAALLDLYADWAPHLRALIQHAEGPWRVWPLYHLDSDLFSPEAEGSAWKHAPGVVLLGDAAHVAIPNGEGVNQAMMDALKLFECLSVELNNNGEDKSDSFDQEADAAALERAIIAYEMEMRPRAREHIIDGMQMAEVMYAADGAQRMIAMFNHFQKAAEQGPEVS
ncbi:FAD/NAD(P)-binding domain-containing protein [Xylariaceae sp. FL1651]|nr:FAD/NAD(P)-binding domain-containing protein [Xylariaceae sp. FL1651]